MGLAFAAPAHAQVNAGPAVCSIIAASEADSWQSAVSMMDIVLENPAQTAEQRANATTHRAEAVMMRDAALGLAARFEGAPDPTVAEMQAMSAMDEDVFYDLLDACDALEDTQIAALLAAERARAQSDAVTDKLQSALTYLEGKVAFSTAVANDYATRVNCATAHATFADSFAQKNRSSAVYLQVRQWADVLTDEVHRIAGDKRRAESDLFGLYARWTREPSEKFRLACAGLLITDGERQVLPLPPPPSATVAPPPQQPRNLFTETIFLGSEVFKQFKPDIPNFLIGYARYADGMDRQVLLLQLLPERQGGASMIAHQYSIDCKGGTIWWLQERRLDDSGGILGVTPKASSPTAPSNALGQAILNASCQMGFMGDVARSPSGWRETKPIR